MNPERKPTLAERFPNSSRPLRNLYRALRGSDSNSFYRALRGTDPDNFKLAAEYVRVRRHVMYAMKFSNELQDVRAAEVALTYAAKILRGAAHDFVASQADDFKLKIDRAARVTKAALALLKSRSK